VDFGKVRVGSRFFCGRAYGWEYYAGPRYFLFFVMHVFTHVPSPAKCMIRIIQSVKKSKASMSDTDKLPILVVDLFLAFYFATKGLDRI
jgi:hypothetical protein